VFLIWRRGEVVCCIGLRMEVWARPSKSRIFYVSNTLDPKCDSKVPDLSKIMISCWATKGYRSRDRLEKRWFLAVVAEQ